MQLKEEKLEVGKGRETKIQAELHCILDESRGSRGCQLLRYREIDHVDQPLLSGIINRGKQCVLQDLGSWPVSDKFVMI
jgi:hypothetical protein